MLIERRDLPHLGYWTAVGGLRCLPASTRLRRCGRIAKRLGRLAYRLDRSGVVVARTNIQAVLGDRLSRMEVETTVRDLFEHIALHKIVNDLLHELSAEELEELLDVEGRHHLDIALARGRGVVFLGAHFGLYGYAPLMALKWKGYEAVGVLGEEVEATDSWIYRRVVSPLRNRARAHLRLIAPTGSPQREMAECLRQNRILLILGDVLDDDPCLAQSPATLPASLLGHRVRFKTGPYRLARWLGSPVLPFFTVPRNGRFTLVIEPPLALSPDSSRRGLLADVAAFTERLTSYLVRHPAQWVHWRRSTLLGQGA